MAKTYAVVVGAVLLLVGICGFFLQPMMGMEFHRVHNAVHILSGLIGLYCGLAAGGKYAGAYAKIFGIVYTLIAIAGFTFWDGTLFAGLSLHLGTPGVNTYNIIHAVVGVAGLAAGFMGGGASRSHAAGA